MHHFIRTIKNNNLLILPGIYYVVLLCIKVSDIHISYIKVNIPAEPIYNL